MDPGNLILIVLLFIISSIIISIIGVVIFKNNNKPVKKTKPVTAVQDINDTVPLLDAAAPKYKDPGRAWYKSNLKKSLINDYAKMFQGNMPVRPLFDVKDIRIDTRPLNTSIYQVQELPGPVPVPNKLIISGKTYVRSTVKEYFGISDGGTSNIFGSNGVNGDLDVQAYVVLTEKAIMNNTGLHPKIGSSAKKILEQFQDDVYRISGGRARYTKIYCAVMGFDRVSGTFGQTKFDISKNCGLDELKAIEVASRYVGAKLGWDTSYARQALMFLAYMPSPCDEWAGIASPACALSCNAYLSGMYKILDWLKTGKPPTGYARSLILHELFHNLGLAHASQDAVEYGEYGDNTTFMGGVKDGNIDLNGLQALVLGWMQNAQMVNVDTLDASGVSVTLPDNIHSCVVVAAPLLTVSSDVRSKYTGFLPCPVLCISIRGSATTGTCVANIHSFDYGAVSENELMRKYYKSSFFRGTLTKEKDKKEFTINTGLQSKSLLPPYVCYDGEVTAKHNVQKTLSQVLAALKISSNKRSDLRIKMAIDGDYSGGGPMKLRISKVP